MKRSIYQSVVLASIATARPIKLSSVIKGVPVALTLAGHTTADSDGIAIVLSILGLTSNLVAIIQLPRFTTSNAW
jgi:ABC-type spermidine/putrescine transport system permease subunit I